MINSQYLSPYLRQHVGQQVVDAVVQAQVLSPTSGTVARDIALGIIGTIMLVVVGFRALGSLADERYGKLITLILAAIPVVGIAYFPDITISILKGLFASLLV